MLHADFLINIKTKKKMKTLTLTGLRGLPNEVEALYITSASAISKGLKDFPALTSAGDRGAINIWRVGKDIICECSVQ